MVEDTRYTYTARLSLRQPVYDNKGRCTGYKHDVCEVEFISRLSDPERTGLEIIHARPVDVEMPEILSRSIGTLGLSTTAEHVLAASGIETVEDLVAMQPYQLFKCKGVGETILQECASALAVIGMSLGIVYCPKSSL